MNEFPKQRCCVNLASNFWLKGEANSSIGRKERQLIDRGTDTHGVLRVADPRTAQGRGTVQQPVLYSSLVGGGGCVRKYSVMREGDLSLAAKSLVRNCRTRNIDIFEVYINYFNIDQKLCTEQ
jgi:hypothetical protein